MKIKGITIFSICWGVAMVVIAYFVLRIFAEGEGSWLALKPTHFVDWFGYCMAGIAIIGWWFYAIYNLAQDLGTK